MSVLRRKFDAGFDGCGVVMCGDTPQESAAAVVSEPSVVLVNERTWGDWEATQEHLERQRQQAELLAGAVDDWDLLPDAEPGEFRPWQRG